MARRRRTTQAVPLRPAHRRDWRAFWQRCSCGLSTPCVDRLVPAAPLPFPARRDRSSFPTPLPAPPTTDNAVPRRASFAATNDASNPWPPTRKEAHNQSRTTHSGFTATSTPPMRKNGPAGRLSTSTSRFARSFEPSCGLPPVRLPIWPAGGCGPQCLVAALAGIGSALTSAARSRPQGSTTSTSPIPTTREEAQPPIATTTSASPPGVSPPTRHGVAGGRPQMASHHINLGRR